MINTPQEAFAYAHQHNLALGHFNVSTLDTVYAIVTAAQNLDLPVFIGVSEGERDFIGIKVLRSVIDAIKAQTGHPVFLNADHTYSLERVKEVVEAGYDSVIFDGAKLSNQENKQQTKAVVEYVKNLRPTMLVEAEIGYIGTSSGLLSELPENAIVSEAHMPTAQSVADFVAFTGVDLISPAVGNIHGMLKNASNPRINLNRIQEIAAAVSIPVILHGGSGITDEEFTAAIKAGIRQIHINTEIRLAWRDGLKSALAADPDQVVPYKLLSPAREAVRTQVEKRLKLFAHR